MFFMPISRWAIAPVFQLLDILYPTLLILLPSPCTRGGERGRKRGGIKQIHWYFESGVLRNVGKNGAVPFGYQFVSLEDSYRCT
jgi:hypothetical protein